MIEKIGRVGPPVVTQGTVPQGPASGNAVDFDKALEHAQVKFSAHAQKRLAEVHLDFNAMSRLEADAQASRPVATRAAEARP